MIKSPKRLASLALALLLLLALLPGNALAADIVESGECGADGDNLTWTLDSNGVLTISGSGEMANYDYGASPWYNRTDISSVVLKSGVTSIGRNAFTFSSGITSVTIPSSVTSIGDFAFMCCYNLTNVTIPNSVMSIGIEAFYYCEELQSVTIPASVTYIGVYPFLYCSNLKGIYVNGSNPEYKDIDGVLFSKDGERLIAFPAGAAGSYTVPAGATSIELGAFLGCTKLTSITIPKSVTEIGNQAFSYCSGLTEFLVENGNNDYTSVDGVLFNKSKMTLVAYPCGKSGSYDIPVGVTYINDYAFAQCTNLTSVTIPNSVMSLGNGAFAYCDGLVDVKIPEGVETIGFGAFQLCRGLNSITIPKTLTYIGVSVFNNCEALTNVYYGGSRAEWESIRIDSNNGSLDNASISFSVPVLTSATASAGQITVKWNAVSGASKYAVYRKIAGGSWTRLTNTVTGTSYTDKSTDLEGGSTYYYTVRAYVGSAWGGYDNTGVHAKAIASVAPELTSATAGSGQITVKWTAVSGASKYAVYRKTSGGSWTRITNTVTGTSYTDKSSDLKAGTTYFYTVRAYVNGTWGDYDTKGVSATAVAATVPALTSATAGSGQITVKWSAVSGASKYAVYRKTSSGSWTRLTNTVTGTSFTDKSSDLKAGTTYYYTVRAYVNGAWGSYDSKGVSTKMLAANIPAPTSAAASAGQIIVKWSAVSGAAKYAVYRKTSGGSWTRLTNTVTGTSYTDKSADLKDGTTYYYTVRAYVNNAWSGYDTTGVSATAIASAPTLVSATVSDGQITVKWNKLTGATKYAVYRKTSGGSWERLANTVTSTSYTDRSAKPGTAYYYTVRAYVGSTWGGYDAKGISAKISWSPDISFSTVDSNGKKWTDSCFQNAKLTMVNLWAYWCGPCCSEMPDLQQLSQDYAGRGLQILGISDEGYEADNIVTMKELGVTYPCLRYVSQFDEYMSTGSIPTTIFIDQYGKVVGKVYVGSRSYQAWAAIIESLLP